MKTTPFPLTATEVRDVQQDVVQMALKLYPQNRVLAAAEVLDLVFAGNEEWKEIDETLLLAIEMYRVTVTMLAKELKARECGSGFVN